MNLLPQFGFLELMLIAVIALVVVGPKDLPKLMRSAGQMVAKARRMASEFTAAFDQMARETEMEEMRQEIEALKKDNVFADAKRSVDEALAPIEKDLRDEANEVKDAMNKPVVERSDSDSDVKNGPEDAAAKS